MATARRGEKSGRALRRGAGPAIRRLGLPAGRLGTILAAMLRRNDYALPLWLVLPVSLGIHLMIGLVLEALPEGGGDVGLPVYHVRIVQAPARPRATRAPISREALGKLEVDAPNFTPPQADDLTAPDWEQSSPEDQAEQDTGGPLPPPEPDLPAAPELPDRPPPLEDSAGIAVERPMPAEQAPPGPPALTALPQAPLPSARRPPPLPKPSAPTLPEAPAPPAAEAADTPLERLRSVIGERRLQSESPVPPPPPRPPQLSGTSRERARSNPLAALALRRYRGHIRERVTDNYNYPADFPCGIVAEARLTISPKGEVLAYELLRPSGNERFDYAVELSVRRTRLDPPAREIGTDDIRPKLRFKSKQCPIGNP